MQRIALFLCIACVCASIAAAQMETKGAEEQPAKQQADASIEGVDYRSRDYGYGHNHDNDRSFYDTLFPGPCPYCERCPTAPTWCTCQCSTGAQNAALTFVERNTENGCSTQVPCSTSPSGSTGAFCDEDTARAAISACSDPNCEPDIGSGANLEIAFCRGGAVLCYTVTCPRDGIITIIGESIPQTGCCNVGTNDEGLFLYAGDYSPGATPLVADDTTLSYTTTCAAGAEFNVCEIRGVIRVHTLSATFLDTTALYRQGACPAGCSSTATCTPA